MQSARSHAENTSTTLPSRHRARRTQRPQASCVGVPGNCSSDWGSKARELVVFSEACSRGTNARTNIVKMSGARLVWSTAPTPFPLLRALNGSLGPLSVFHVSQGLSPFIPLFYYLQTLQNETDTLQVRGIRWERFTERWCTRAMRAAHRPYLWDRQDRKGLKNEIQASQIAGR